MDEGLLHLPINVAPDHDHIYHGVYEERVSKDHASAMTRSPFRVGRMEVRDWLQLVVRQVTKVIEQGGVATLVAHPACMEIADNFKTFSELCSILSGFESIRISEALCAL
jgi:hypothetical protein